MNNNARGLKTLAHYYPAQIILDFVNVNQHRPDAIYSVKTEPACSSSQALHNKKKYQKKNGNI